MRTAVVTCVTCLLISRMLDVICSVATATELRSRAEELAPSTALDVLFCVRIAASDIPPAAASIFVAAWPRLVITPETDAPKSCVYVSMAA